ncbi:MAG: cobalamin-dependent protein, partial [Candidatus Methylomirabilis sp.]|nr:cobalamin-dependent protein [Deltaproteobacteria bacterium]
MSVVSLVKVSHRNSRLACVHPLGILYLAAALRRDRPGRHAFLLHDMNLRRESPEETAALVLRAAPDVLGLSAMTHDAQAAHALARLVKARRPETVVVLGGPYAEGDVGKILANEAIDYVAVGEGERAFCALMRELEAGERESRVPGVAYRRGREVVANPAETPMTG